MTGEELADALERYECPCGPYDKLSVAAARLRELERERSSMQYAIVRLAESVGLRVLRPDETERLRSADRLAESVGAHLLAGDHGRGCAITRAAVWGQKASCTCGRDEMKAALADYRGDGG